MTTDTPKKKGKLTLLNEQLPAPTAEPRRDMHLPSNVPSPRDRVLKRLARLAAPIGGVSAMSACLGFGVVDYLPEPVSCVDSPEGPATWLRSAAERNDEGTIVFTVTLSGNFPEVTGVAVSSDVTVENARLLDAERIDETSIRAFLLADPGTTEVTVTVPLRCEGQDNSMIVRLTLDEAGDVISIDQT